MNEIRIKKCSKSADKLFPISINMYREDLLERFVENILTIYVPLPLREVLQRMVKGAK